MAREDNALTRRLPSVVANWLISALLRVPLHDYGCTLKAYRREVLEDVRLYGEMHRFIPIYAAWKGPASPRSRSVTTRAGSADRNTALAASRGCCSIC